MPSFNAERVLAEGFPFQDLGKDFLSRVPVVEDFLLTGAFKGPLSGRKPILTPEVLDLLTPHPSSSLPEPFAAVSKRRTLRL